MLGNSLTHTQRPRFCILSLCKHRRYYTQTNRTKHNPPPPNPHPCPPQFFFCKPIARISGKSHTNTPRVRTTNQPTNQPTNHSPPKKKEEKECERINGSLRVTYEVRVGTKQKRGDTFFVLLLDIMHLYFLFASFSFIIYIFFYSFPPPQPPNPQTPPPTTPLHLVQSLAFFYTTTTTNKVRI